MGLAYEYVTSAERLGHIAAEAAQSDAIALDLETTPKPEWRHLEWAALSPHTGRMRLCSINTGKRVYVIDLFQTKTLGPLKTLLHNPLQLTGKGHPIVVGQNLKFDQTYLYAHEGIELWPVFDTFRASSLIYNGKGVGLRGIGHNLYDLYARELGQQPIAPDLGGSDWGADVLTPEQLDYAAEDVTFLLPLRKVLRPKLEHAGLMQIAAIEFGSILPEASVEINGFPINMDSWVQVAKSNHAKMLALAKVLIRELPNPYGQMLLPGASEWIFDEQALTRWALDVSYDEEGNRTERERTEDEQKQARRTAKGKGRKDKLTFNLDSTEQMLMSLHRVGGTLRTLESTREMSLAMFSSEYPIISRLLEYRGYATKLKSFGPEYKEYINPVTGRIHPGYFPMLVTGRFAARNPNLGQIPRDKEYRACFQAPPGWRFVIADYSGIEMRLAAEISGDATLIRLFREDVDPHFYTASKLLQKPMDQVTKSERQQAKPANFGFLYGMQAEKFVLYAMTGYGVKLSLDQSKEFRQRFFDEYTGLQEWHETTLRQGKRTRMTYTPLGRLRYCDETAHNEYLNHPVQGAGADGLKRALREVFRRTRKYNGDVTMNHHVHDEIITLVRDDADLVKAWEADMKEGMESAMSGILKRVPALAEPGNGYSWADK
jgi:DNA polymerase-1